MSKITVRLKYVRRPCIDWRYAISLCLLLALLAFAGAALADAGKKTEPTAPDRIGVDSTRQVTPLTPELKALRLSGGGYRLMPTTWVGSARSSSAGYALLALVQPQAPSSGGCCCRAFLPTTCKNVN